MGDTDPVAYKTLADDDLENRGSALHPDGRVSEHDDYEFECDLLPEGW